MGNMSTTSAENMTNGIGRSRARVIAAVIAVLALAFLMVTVLGVTPAKAQSTVTPGSEDQQAQGQLPPPPPGADQQGEPQADSDAGVARASFIHGDVSMQRGDSGDWSAVTLNTPLMAGDKISTGDSSRTELELDFANVLRLDAGSQANLATLSSSRIQVQVAQGLVNFSVLKGSQTDAEIDTPNVAVHPHGEGRYRIHILSNGDSEIIVREGEADISTSEGSTTVHKGQLITVHGMGADAQYRTANAPAGDEFDTWNNYRDGIIYDANAYQHTNHYYTGAGDLDPYGTWSEVPDYGSVWIPSVGPGWAPYRSGRWIWEPYYGWTWTSYEPWGWAPYHYGRWFLYNNSWAWWPGPAFSAYRPIWAPAYVSFFGFGGHVGVGVGFGFGSIGWLPIGPCDFFHPWWGGFRERFGVVDIAHVGTFRGGFAPLHGGNRFSNFNSVLVNDRMRAGISSVGAGNFGRGSVMSRPVSAADFRGGRMMTGNVPVAPTRESLRASDRPVSSASARASARQNFFSNRVPAARPQSFNEQASHMQQAIQRGGQDAGNFRGAGNSGTNFGGGATAANGGRSNTGAGASPSFRPQGQSGAPQSQARGGTQEGQNWQRFNSPSAQQGGGQSNSRAGEPQGNERSFGNQGGNQGAQAQSPRGGTPGGQAEGGWQRFTPQARGGARPDAPSSGFRGGGQTSSRPQSTYRPPLDMSKPVINQRSYQGASPAYRGSAPSSRGYEPSRTYSAPSRSYSPPSRSYSAPRAPSRSFGGGGGHAGGGGGRTSGGGGHGGGGGRR